ncbi:zincin [Teratosphaeria nubilosa]|uniref:Zincin n=1 Tax=Teratosphaeria nubilosa TaxID=161662 RepID=A0A6G1LC10_9PEZI|nr:zincin [Teratosphaeria nubilosa]
MSNDYSCESYQHAIELLQHFTISGTTSTDPTTHLPNINFFLPPFWPPGTELRVGFMTGTDWQKMEVELHAHEWTRFANLSLKFVEQRPYDILVDFSPGASWSQIGVLSKLATIRHQPSMNLADVNTTISGRDRRAQVLHQFGHALGLVHEHQHGVKHPEDNLAWDRQALYRHFGQSANAWSHDQINSNVLANCTGDLVLKPVFDVDSVMLYGFPMAMFKSGHGKEANAELSAIDKEYMMLKYPGREKAWDEWKQHEWHVTPHTQPGL